MFLTREQEEQFNQCNTCHICEQQVVDKVRDHDHLTWSYRGCACKKCSINLNYKNF
jgi:hypothetical protein